MISSLPRRSLVTGAGRGLGLEFVRQLLRGGDTVVAASRQTTPALAELQVLHGEALQIVALDVGDFDRLPEFAYAVGQRIEALDLLINNAGVLVPGERFGQLHASALETSLRINTIAPLLLTQALTALLTHGHAPLVANISSTLGSIASTHQFHTPSYAISKAGLNMAGVMMAQALIEPGIRVVNLHPGWVRTEMGGPQANLEPEEAVHAMLATLKRLPIETTGVFLDRHGEPLPW
ncbi:MAG TPA: SDR family oxidoreductase [Arenimonas sp.]|uniref:SDR family oxidoreductase n=1 Tax=Arenimonas sp. TaxID=1872635 RepID=UPI002BB086C7|nr:SDR family oxidoreductase [Arenimonas sp.]HMB57129.1 SDR family oxidoreductase [Arenimonas sp.]